LSAFVADFIDLCDDPLPFDDMKWTKPEHGTSKITAAGKIISGRKHETEHFSWDAAFNIAANWRSAHAYPLHALSMTLRNRARKIDDTAIIAQRLKRMPSILAKLRRFSGMQLSQMQDLGGCRAVMAHVEDVDKLVSYYESKPIRAARLCEKYDHIGTPKPDGYRGVHLVYSYQSMHEARSVYNNLRIEIQIRSVYQHAWATAVETIDTFTRQGLKSGIGESDWRRFFLLVSSFIAMMELRPTVGKPVVGADLGDCDWFHELDDLIRRLGVIPLLEGISAGIHIAANIPAAASYILILNPDDRSTEVIGFDNEESAAQRYLEIERSTLGDTSVQAVMVSVDSVDALREAYPNYYLDTARFIGILKGFLESTESDIETTD
jgi:ppGpp synthetase/RelA/SpoT-type nucleotidyltranferase